MGMNSSGDTLGKTILTGPSPISVGRKQMKILLTIDGSPCSDAAVAEVAQRPWPAASEIKVLSVFEPPVVPTPEAWTIPPDYFEEMTSVSRSAASKVVDTAMAMLKGTLAESITIS
jgi:hypothetical protein